MMNIVTTMIPTQMFIILTNTIITNILNKIKVCGKHIKPSLLATRRLLIFYIRETVKVSACRSLEKSDG